MERRKEEQKKTRREVKEQVKGGREDIHFQNTDNLIAKQMAVFKDVNAIEYTLYNQIAW